MHTYVIVVNNEKQYIMRNNHIVKIEKIFNNIGDIIQFNNVLLYSNINGVTIIGSPYVYNCKVYAVVCEQSIGKKIRVLKFKRRKNYIRRYGSRQIFTKIKIVSIVIY